jgi:hypothetical protein
VTASIDGQLRFAIAGKRLIEVNYKGAVRLCEPHDYGEQKGVVRLLVYQRRTTFVVPGKSATGWRMLDVAKIEKCVVTDQMFEGSRGPADQSHIVWDELYARVK